VPATVSPLKADLLHATVDDDTTSQHGKVQIGGVSQETCRSEISVYPLGNKRQRYDFYSLPVIKYDANRQTLTEVGVLVRLVGC
jgi:hypothetical protein